MIQIFPYSTRSVLVAFLIKWYFISHHKRLHIKLSSHPYRCTNSTIYFIIKSRGLTSKKMNDHLRNIRTHSESATIIIIGEDIDYASLFKHHYRIFGVIDTTKNKSLTFIQEQLHFYLDGLYDLKKKKWD